jgi:Big-like domain-containing protein
MTRDFDRCAGVRRAFLSSFVVVLSIAGSSCGGSPIAPPRPPGPGGSETPAPAGILTTIRIGTNPLVLRAAGETGQLTVEAFFSNGTSLDRTAEAQWTSQDSHVATVAPGGIVTAVGTGATRIDATFDGKRSTTDVVITPAGTFGFRGIVREPGSGPMPGVLVQERGSGRSETTDQNGEFGFAGLQQARFRVATEGFEVVEVEVVPRPGDANIPRLSVDIPLQRIVRLDAGASRSQLTIAADDVGYATGAGFCWPCKLIRVATGRTGTLRVAVTPQVSALNVWIDGRRFTFSGSNISAQTAVAQPGEVLVYVGWSLSYVDPDPVSVSFGITTSIDDQ